MLCTIKWLQQHSGADKSTNPKQTNFTHHNPSHHCSGRVPVRHCCYCCWSSRMWYCVIMVFSVVLAYVPTTISTETAVLFCHKPSLFTPPPPTTTHNLPLTTVPSVGADDWPASHGHFVVSSLLCHTVCCTDNPMFNAGEAVLCW